MLNFFDHFADTITFFLQLQTYVILCQINAKLVLMKVNIYMYFVSTIAIGNIN